MLSVGILTVMGLATLMSWRMSSLAASVFSAMSCLCVLVVPESPTWLVRRDRLLKAEQAIHRLLGPSRRQQAKETLLNLRKRYSAERKTSDSFSQRITNYRRYLNSSFLKPFLIIHGINVFIQLFCGNHLVINYSVDMVSRMTEHYDPYVTNTIFSLIRTLMCVVVGILMTIIGRRALMMISGVGSTISSVILAAVITPGLGVHIQPEVAETLSIVLLGLYVASFTSGYFIIPTMMIGETQPAAVRGILCGYIFTINDLTAGDVVKVYPWLLRTLDLHGMFLMFGVACAICVVIAYLFLPETQGKTLEEIEDYFKQKNIMWITRNKGESTNLLEVHHLPEESADSDLRRESAMQVN